MSRRIVVQVDDLTNDPLLPVDRTFIRIGGSRVRASAGFGGLDSIQAERVVTQAQTCVAFCRAVALHHPTSITRRKLIQASRPRLVSPALWLALVNAWGAAR